MRTRLYTVALLVALLVPLAGCATTLEFPRPDPAKTTCAADPTLPEPPVTDAKNAQYLKGLHGAWQDCSDTVAWWRDW